MKKLRSTSCFLVFLVLGCCQATENFVQITTSSGNTIQVKVELADNAAERAEGLMFRENLPEGEGMLFIFPSETQSSFWMKNTPISLDLIFINEGVIVDIIEDTVPFSETLLTPGSNYIMTLEVPGGYAARQSIQIGDAVQTLQ